jgi:hypothetical protein
MQDWARAMVTYVKCITKLALLQTATSIPLSDRRALHNAAIGA